MASREWLKASLSFLSELPPIGSTSSKTIAIGPIYPAEHDTVARLKRDHLPRLSSALSNSALEISDHAPAGGPLRSRTLVDDAVWGSAAIEEDSSLTVVYGYANSAPSFGDNLTDRSTATDLARFDAAGHPVWNVPLNPLFGEATTRIASGPRSLRPPTLKCTKPANNSTSALQAPAA